MNQFPATKNFHFRNNKFREKESELIDNLKNIKQKQKTNIKFKKKYKARKWKNGKREIYETTRKPKDPYYLAK